MQTHQVKFTGNTKEYFGIWIVNVLLTIVTLGIYGAWAKVRDKKYMYGNTQIDGHSFNYHATGKQIFIGRLIVGAAFLVLALMSAISPILYLIGILALFAAVPFIIVRALRFNSRVTSYRNVRFDFIGKAGEAFVTYFLMPLGNVFTLYLCTPFLTRASQRFMTNNALYGDRPMNFKADIGHYYKPFFIAIGVGLLGYIPVVFAVVKAMGLEATSVATMMAVSIPLYIGIFLVSIAALIYQVMVRNVHFNNTKIDGQHQLKSDVRAGRYIGIVVVNALAALFTLGLMIPWGRIRLAKYMASVTAVESEGSLEGYTSSVQETAGVVSSEYVDLEGFDIDIGI